jgi:hypothetical protein
MDLCFVPSSIPGVRRPTQPTPLPAVLDLHVYVQPVPPSASFQELARKESQEVSSAHSQPAPPYSDVMLPHWLHVSTNLTHAFRVCLQTLGGGVGAWGWGAFEPMKVARPGLAMQPVACVSQAPQHTAGSRVCAAAGAQHWTKRSAVSTAQQGNCHLQGMPSILHAVQLHANRAASTETSLLNRSSYIWHQV